MIRFALWRKIIAQLLLLTLLAELAPVALFAAEGPATPEAAQFEPVDTTDLVNLFTGNFTYNLPLLEVPGPEGSWPLNLAYHAGVNPNTEATWVGLGWTLNPGSINRFVSGYPDDYFGGALWSEYDASGKGKGFSVGVGYSYGPGHIGINYSSNGGFGFNASVRAGGVGAGYDSRSGVGLSYSKGFVNLSLTTSGIGISTNISLLGGPGQFDSDRYAKGNNQIDYGKYYGDAITKVGSSAQFDFKSGKVQGGFNLAGLGISHASGNAGNLKTNTTSIGLNIPIPTPIGIFDISLGFSETEWWYRQQQFDRGVGTLHQVHYQNYWETKTYNLEDLWGSSSDNVYSEFQIFAEESAIHQIVNPSTARAQLGNKFERSVLDNDIIVTSEDAYSVNVQGLSGSFRPYFDYGVTIEDFDGDDDITEDDREGILTVLANDKMNLGPHIKFRLDYDAATNFIGRFGSYSDYGSINPEGAQYGSTRILPAIDKETGRLLGFKITTIDGKTYEFYRSVRSFYEYSYMKRPKNNFHEHSDLETSYATSWLITGIKGPDYVDRGAPGYSSDDWGFWVKFNYSESPSFAYWRAPNTGFAITKDESGNVNKETSSYSSGIKERVYLSSVETATHLLACHTSGRLDDKPSFGSYHGVTLAAYKASTIWKSTYMSVECQQEDCGGGGGGTSYSPYARIIFDIPYSKIQELKQLAESFGPDYPNRAYVYMATQHFTNGVLDDYRDPNGFPYKSTMSAPLGTSMFDLFQPYENGKQSYVDFPNFEIKPWSQTITGYAFIAAWLHIPTIASNFSKPSTAKKLDRITLHKKRLLLDSDLTDYEQTLTQPILEGVDFDYDYSLCQNSPNSSAPAGGKLTLRSVQKTGSAGAIFLPKNEFTYANNPGYGAQKWDVWNSYSSVGEEKEHYPAQDLNTANSDVGAWNLTSILSPLGASIEVEYETDMIAYINDVSAQDAELQQTYDRTTYINGIMYLSIYGGGHRVRTIAVESEGDTRKTRYKYGPGVTSFLPSAYFFKLYNTDLAEDILINKGFNILGPSPSVGYSHVEVYEVDPNQTNETILSGKTIYQYFTAKDYPFRADENGDAIEIRDKTILIGQLKKKEVFGIKPSGDLYIVQDDVPLYQFSSDLLKHNTPINGLAAHQRYRWAFKNRQDYVNGITQPMGLTQQKYNTKNDDRNMKSIKHTRENVYTVGSQSTIYHYDNSGSQTGSTSTYTLNIGYDVYSGTAITMEAGGSKNERIFKEIHPAHWFYPDMRERNMLTQIAVTRDFSLPATEVRMFYDNNYLSQTTYDDNWKLPYLMSASVTTWKDWGNGVWRQNDTYTATKTGSNYIDFTNWTAANNESTNPEAYDFPNGWRRTSNITAYDRYGHPTEERGLDGTYTSSIYGYGDALPIAIVQNAKTSQIRFYNFENSSYTSGGKTGDYSKSYSGTVAEMTTPNVPGTSFMVSGWIKPSQSTILNGVTYPANGQWQYFEVKNVTANTTPEILAGQGQIDDIRIHPMDATMSTFTYDNLTWKVTAISDANSIITFYEYDGAGRLVKVYDQDKNLIKKHTYQYKRTN